MRVSITRRRLLGALGSVGACAAAPLPAFAQAWPERPVKLLHGFAAGGNADTVGRILAASLQQQLGQVFNVEPKPGAGGTLAADAAAKSRPDGYTLLLATGGHAVAGALYEKLPYQTVTSFQMVSTITFFPFLIVTQADNKLRHLGEALAAARAKPESVAYGSAGVGSTHHLAGELLSRMAGAPLLHVPYKGDAASVTALLAGDIPLVIAPPTAVLGHLKSGKLRALAVTGPQRWPGMPEVPTVAEQGVAGFDVRSWAGWMLPAGTPAAVVDRLNAETQKALQLSNVRQRLEEMGGEARGSTPQEMTAMVAAELQKWTQVVTDAKIPRL